VLELWAYRRRLARGLFRRTDGLSHVSSFSQAKDQSFRSVSHAAPFSSPAPAHDAPPPSVPATVEASRNADVARAGSGSVPEKEDDINLRADVCMEVAGAALDGADVEIEGVHDEIMNR